MLSMPILCSLSFQVQSFAPSDFSSLTNSKYKHHVNKHETNTRTSFNTHTHTPTHTNTITNTKSKSRSKSAIQNASEMQTIAEGVQYNTIAREWRAKWSNEGNKASLVACQMALESVVEDLYEVDGVVSVERVVCGDCLDFKVITSVSADKFNKWKKDKFEPEEFFIEMLNMIDDVSQIETQTYTKMPVEITDFIDE